MVCYSDCEFKDELIEDGMKRYSVAEFNQLKNKKISESTDSGFRESYKNNKINNKGEYLFPIKAIFKIGWTIQDKAFRNFTYEKLMEGNAIKKVLKVQNEKTLQFILEMAKKGELVAPDQLFDVIECMTLSKSLNSITGVKEATEDLVNIGEEYKKLKDKISLDISNNVYKGMERKRMETKRDSLISLNQQIDSLIIEYKDLLIEFKDKLFEQISSNPITNLTDIICERDEEAKKYKNNNERIKLNKLINEYKEALVEVGVFKKLAFTVNANKTKKDKDGNIVSLAKTKYKYLPTEKYEWLKYSQVGNITQTNASQLIKLSKYGSMAYNYIFDKIETEEEFKHFTEDDFKDYVLEKMN